MALQRLHLIQQVLVVGGGVSGLLSALFSVQRGAPRVLLFEAEGSLCGAGGRASFHRLAACERFVEACFYGDVV